MVFLALAQPQALYPGSSTEPGYKATQPLDGTSSSAIAIYIAPCLYMASIITYYHSYRHPGHLAPLYTHNDYDFGG